MLRCVGVALRAAPHASDGPLRLALLARAPAILPVAAPHALALPRAVRAFGAVAASAPVLYKRPAPAPKHPFERMRKNRAIRAASVRVVDDESGEQLGVMSLANALRIAQERELDLVEVAPDAQPPVCKLMDIGRALYRLKKQRQAARKNRAPMQMKEMHFRPNIGEHDVDHKLRRVREFLDKRYTVRLVVRLPNPKRYPDALPVGQRRLADIVEQLKDVAQPSGAVRHANTVLVANMRPLARAGSSGGQAAGAEAGAGAGAAEELAYEEELELGEEELQALEERADEVEREEEAQQEEAERRRAAPR